MSCGFCHLGPSPVKPPADPGNPKWENLSSSVGAQYMWVDRLFIHNSNKPEGRKNFMFQLAHTFRPGSMDTSLVSTDSINNPRTMNAVYDFPDRMGVAKKLGEEKLEGGERDNKQFNDFITSGPLTEFYSKADQTVHTPHVLKDGADSVGLLGALNRVYLNIGLFSEEWLLHFNPVVGGKTITPIRIADAQKNSSYWQATELGTPDTALFFLKAARPDHLKDAPGGDKYLNADAATLDKGKTVFADTCARCHSSKAPPVKWTFPLRSAQAPATSTASRNTGPGTQTDDYKAKMRAIVKAPDFLDNNYLSTEVRIPATLLRTNVCSPLATNALAGNIWDNFSSSTYKSLPSVGTVTVADPFTGEPRPYAMPAGGRGYTRVPSLISIWSTAPFLLNNSVGPFDISPSVEARMKVFDASIEQMLWPEKRERDAELGNKVNGLIDRTTERSSVTIPVGFVPEALQPLQGTLHRWLPGLVTEGGDVVLGPGAQGHAGRHPVEPQAARRGRRPGRQGRARHQARRTGAQDEGRPAVGAGQRHRTSSCASTSPTCAKPLLALSKCPDYVVNRGHYFGTAEFNRQDGLSADERSFGKEPELSDDDKRALISFLKTF